MRSQHLLAGSALTAVIALGAAGAASAASPVPVTPTDPVGPSSSADLVAPTASLAPASLAPAANPVVIQPNPVAPGGQFSVFDGGNCTGTTGVATFRGGAAGSAIPAVTLSTLSNQVGGVGTVPEGTAPGDYQVSVVCQNGTAMEGPFTGTLTVAATTPRGAVQTGLGGGIGMNPAETALGAALVAAALTGTVALGRRRARGGDDS